MTRDDSQSCLAFSEEHSCMAFQSFTFHKTAATVGLETKPTLAATRNETGRNNYQTLPIVIRTEHYMIFAQQNCF